MSFELENLSAHATSRSSAQNLPSIKEEESEDKISILVDKLDSAIDVIKLRENEIKRLDDTINKLNEMSTSRSANQIVSQEQTLPNKNAEKRKMNRILKLGIALTIAAVIALIVLMVAFGFIIAFIFEK